MPPVTTNKEIEVPEPLLAFDGSPMPTVALPTVPQKTIDMLLASIVPLKDKRVVAKGMIYGNVGTQKTTNAMKILQGITPEDQYILYIDTAEGWSVLQNYPELKRRVIHLQFENIEQLWAVANAIKSKAGQFGNIGGILFDEYTGMHDDDLNWVVESRAEQKAKLKEFKDPFSPALPDYNAARIRSNKTISRFMALQNVNLMFIGHEREDKRLNKIPDMPDKAGKALYQKLHFLYHAHYEANGKLVLQTTGSQKITAKNRINGIGAFTTAEEVVECYSQWGTPESKSVEVKPVDETADNELLKLLAD